MYNDEEDFGYKKTSVVDMAYEIVDMHRMIQKLSSEIEDLREYKQKYFDLLNGSIEHGEKMIGGILMLAMKMGDKEGVQS